MLGFIQGVRPSRIRRFRLRGIVAIALTIAATEAAFCHAVFAQAEGPETSPTIGPGPELTSEAIESLRKQAEESTDLDEAAKTKALELTRQALDNLTRARELESRTADYQDRLENLQQRLLEIQQDSEALKERPEFELPRPDRADLAELEQQLKQQEIALAARKKELAEAEAEPKQRANRRKELRTQLATVSDRLAEINRQLEAAPPPDEPPLLTLSRRRELETRRQAVQQEVPAYQSELALYDAEDNVNLLTQKRDLLAQQVAAIQQEVNLLRDFIAARRAEEARRRVAQARRESQLADPLLRGYALENEELAEDVRKLVGKTKSADEALKQVKARLEELTGQIVRTQEKIDQVGLTEPIGLLLRKQAADLPDLEQHRENIEARRTIISDVHLKLFDLNDRRAELANLEPLIDQIVAGADRKLDENQQAKLEADAEDVLRTQREYLDELVRSYNAYFDTLVELDNQERQLVEKAEEYADFIGERVLWIRSGAMITPAVIQRDWDSLRWLTDGEHWKTLGQVLWEDAQADPIALASGVLLLLALMFFGRRFRQELTDIGEQARRGNFTQFGPTIRAGLLTVLISFIAPGVLLYMAWRLNVADGNSPFVAAVAVALVDAAEVVFVLQLIRQFCRKHGLADAHFGWPLSAVKLLRTNVTQLMALGVPLMFVTDVLHERGAESLHDGMERVAYIATMIVLAVFLQRVLRPNEGVFREIVAYDRGGWVDRFKHLWYVLGLLGPLSLAALAFVGYYYTAQQLTVRLQTTAWLVLVLLAVRAFAMRWILVHHRKLRIEQLRERRAAALENAAAGSEGAPQPELPQVSEPEIDLAAVSTQTRRLLIWGLFVVAMTGLWMIWVDVTPALGILDRWELWNTTTQMTEAVDGQGAVRTREVVEAVTVADLLLAVLIGLFTVVAARNLPGLLEMSLLTRLPIEAAVRYAVTSLASYAIILIGIITGCNALGIRWSNVQWLAAAITVGLGFGLQEIFANFVSGLILLFERPLRVGDVVTIGNVSGSVSRIRIRATTIVDWDRKELVVPNKEFVTGQLINWTLSDNTLRIVLNVQIAYGSDTALAHKMLLQIARDHPVVLKDPEPICIFAGFGESTLDFELRVYVPSIDYLLRVKHELNMTIDQTFRKAGIEIAFPQRDLHVRSLPDALNEILVNGRATSRIVERGRSEHA